MKMKPLIITCISAIPFLVGCSTTYYVPQISDADEFVDAQAKLHGRPATVTLVDGTEIRLDSTLLRLDSVVGIQEDTRLPQVWPLSQVKEIRTIHLGRGAARGGMNGFIGGGGYGLLLGATALGDQGSMVKTGADVWALGLFSGLIGATIGTLGGMAVLSTEHYTFSEDTTAPFRGQETKRRGVANPQYVLAVEKFLEETNSTVTIAWQGKQVTLPKSEITIEKHEKGYRITVPTRLLQ